MLEVFKNGTNNITNSNNRSFNLNFFLNEQCKDAMNIMDFVESLKLKLGDLETMGGNRVCKWDDRYYCKKFECVGCL